MYETTIIRQMWNLYKILCVPLFRMGRSLALLQRIYVRPETRATKYGSALMHTALHAR